MDEKAANDGAIGGALLGAGAGGLIFGGGQAVSNLWNRKDPRKQESALEAGLGGAMLGATAGGVLGSAADAVGNMPRGPGGIDSHQRPGATPNQSTTRTLGETIAPYYAKAPGGLAAATAAAQKAMPNGSQYGLTKWDPEKMHEPTKVVTVDKPYLGNRPGLGGVTVFSSSPFDQRNKEVTVAAPGHRLDIDPAKQLLEHELTHRGLQPKSHGETWSQARDQKPIQVPQPFGSRITSDGWKYMSEPDELKAWMAPIKRQWVQATGRQMLTPADAEEAVGWYLGKSDRDPQTAEFAKGYMADPGGRRILLQQLLQLVQGKPNMDVSKLAGLAKAAVDELAKQRESAINPGSLQESVRRQEAEQAAVGDLPGDFSLNEMNSPAATGADLWRQNQPTAAPQVSPETLAAISPGGFETHSLQSQHADAAQQRAQAGTVPGAPLLSAMDSPLSMTGTDRFQRSTAMAPPPDLAPPSPGANSVPDRPLAGMLNKARDAWRTHVQPVVSDIAASPTNQLGEGYPSDLLGPSSNPAQPAPAMAEAPPTAPPPQVGVASMDHMPSTETLTTPLAEAPAEPPDAVAEPTPAPQAPSLATAAPAAPEAPPEPAAAPSIAAPQPPKWAQNPQIQHYLAQNPSEVSKFMNPQTGQPYSREAQNQVWSGMKQQGGTLGQYTGREQWAGGVTPSSTAPNAQPQTAIAAKPPQPAQPPKPAAPPQPAAPPVAAKPPTPAKPMGGASAPAPSMAGAKPSSGGAMKLSGVVPQPLAFHPELYNQLLQWERQGGLGKGRKPTGAPFDPATMTLLQQHTGIDVPDELDGMETLMEMEDTPEYRALPKQAWTSESAGKIAGLTPFAEGFLVRCTEAGMDDLQIKAAAEKASLVHPEVAEILLPIIKRAELLAKVAAAIDLNALPGPEQSRHITNLLGLDAQMEAQRKVLRDGHTGLAAKMSPTNMAVMQAARRSATHQATHGPSRWAGAIMGDELVGPLIDTFSSFGGGNPEVRNKLRQWAETSGLNKARDPVDPSVPGTSNETPWHLAMQGNFAKQDIDVGHHRWNRQNRPLNYWLNPLDQTGPLNELGDRLLRRTFAGNAEPETRSGRFFRSAVPLLGTFKGNAAAQAKIRSQAHRNGLYGAGEGKDVTPEERAQAILAKQKKDEKRDADGDGMVDDGKKSERPVAKAAGMFYKDLESPHLQLMTDDAKPDHMYLAGVRTQEPRAIPRMLGFGPQRDLGKAVGRYNNMLDASPELKNTPTPMALGSILQQLYPKRYREPGIEDYVQALAHMPPTKTKKPTKAARFGCGSLEMDKKVINQGPAVATRPPSPNVPLAPQRSTTAKPSAVNFNKMGSDDPRRFVPESKTTEHAPKVRKQRPYTLTRRLARGAARLTVGDAVTDVLDPVLGNDEKRSSAGSFISGLATKAAPKMLGAVDDVAAAGAKALPQAAAPATQSISSSATQAAGKVLAPAGNVAKTQAMQPPMTKLLDPDATGPWSRPVRPPLKAQGGGAPSPAPAAAPPGSPPPGAPPAAAPAGAPVPPAAGPTTAPQPSWGAAAAKTVWNPSTTPPTGVRGHIGHAIGGVANSAAGRTAGGYGIGTSLGSAYDHGMGMMGHDTEGAGAQLGGRIGLGLGGAHGLGAYSGAAPGLLGQAGDVAAKATGSVLGAAPKTMGALGAAGAAAGPLASVGHRGYNDLAASMFNGVLEDPAKMQNLLAMVPPEQLQQTLQQVAKNMPPEQLQQLMQSLPPEVMGQLSQSISPEMIAEHAGKMSPEQLMQIYSKLPEGTLPGMLKNMVSSPSGLWDSAKNWWTSLPIEQQLMYGGGALAGGLGLGNMLMGNTGAGLGLGAAGAGLLAGGHYAPQIQEYLNSRATAAPGANTAGGSVVPHSAEPLYSDQGQAPAGEEVQTITAPQHRNELALQTQGQ